MKIYSLGLLFFGSNVSLPKSLSLFRLRSLIKTPIFGVLTIYLPSSLFLTIHLYWDRLVFGKLTIDGPPKLFILDFDRCESYNLERLLGIIASNVRYSRFDFDILGRKHVMTLNKLGELKFIFNEGYLEYPRMLNPETVQLAETILTNYSK